MEFYQPKKGYGAKELAPTPLKHKARGISRNFAPNPTIIRIRRARKYRTSTK
jgi:hypothetical protein